MNGMDMEDAIAQQFGQDGLTMKEAEVAHVCESLASEFGMRPEDVAREYGVMHSLKGSDSMEVQVVHVNTKAFRDHLAKAQKESTKAKGGKRTAAGTAIEGVKQPLTPWENIPVGDLANYHPTPKRQAVGATPGSTGSKGLSMQLPGLTARTPHTQPRTPFTQPRMSSITAGLSGAPGSGLTAERTAQRTPSASATKFDSLRTAAKGEVVCVLNAHLPEWEAPSAVGTWAGVQPAGPQLPAAGQHTYMMDSLDVRVQAIEDRLTDWAQHLAAAIPEASEAGQQPVTQITQEPAWYVGRVVLESSSEEGPAARLALSSIQLEGSRAASDGARVRLDVSKVQAPAVRLFPGQMVGVQGVNPTGNAIIAQTVCTSLPAPLAPTSQAPRPFCMMVAAGPYTTNDALCFSPLDQLLQHCEACKPDVLMLLGPFLDAGHAAVRSGLLSQTFDAVFQEEVLQRITGWQATWPQQRTQVVLVPSSQDVHHAPVLPTPAFSLPSCQPSSLTSLQNPCTFSLPDGVVVGSSSTDVLKALSGCELAVNAAGTDRMAALASQLVGQRNWFPIFPPPLGSCLDMSHTAAMNMANTPHIMLLPSDLAPFAKLLQVPQAATAHVEPVPATVATQQQVVCVNPGRVVRGAMPGTFAVVCVHPGACDVSDRCRIEVRRV